MAYSCCAAVCHLFPGTSLICAASPIGTDHFSDTTVRTCPNGCDMPSGSSAPRIRPIAIAAPRSFIESLNRQGGLWYDVRPSKRATAICCRAVSSDASPSNRFADFIAGRVGRQGVSSAPALCVVGPSGIGKSRLINQVRQQVQLQGTAFLESSCLDYASTNTDQSQIS